MGSPGGKRLRQAGATALLTLVACTVAATAFAAKPSVYFPVDRVVCDRKNFACYDSLGASVPLTKAHLGDQAARILDQRISHAGKAWDANHFVLSNGVECFVGKKTCFVRAGSDEIEPEITTQLFGRH